MSNVCIGVSGSRRNATIAIAVDGRLAAVCEQERVTRARGVGIKQGGFPFDALVMAARTAGVSRDEANYAIAEGGFDLPHPQKVWRFDYRFAHAAGAFGTSPFTEAAVLVCDRHAAPELSFWQATPECIIERPHGFEAPAFATIYAGLAEGLGFAPSGHEHLLESLARTGGPDGHERAASILGYAGGALHPPRDYIAQIDAWHREAADDRIAHAAGIATAVQRVLAEALVDVVRRAKDDEGRLCVAGDLFYNSFFNTALRQAGVIDELFVPVNPGDPGVSVGCALAAAGPPHDAPAGGGEERSEGVRRECPEPASPFLGPGFLPEEIKRVLDNCKLHYDYVDDRTIERVVVDALIRGQLVAWFQGAMEWGPRALGNRSILASPFAPHVLENLNHYLKQRESYRTYGVSICAEDLPLHFDGPASSDFMQYEFTAKDPDRFRPLLANPGARLRVHTVGAPRADRDHGQSGRGDEQPAEEPLTRFRRVLKAFGEASDAPVLVNTSFNGFHEPIVCTPRDAVRVFYGTGIDMLVMGHFIVSK